MSLISFFKEAGEKLFGKKVQEVQAAPAKVDAAARLKRTAKPRARSRVTSIRSDSP